MGFFKKIFSDAADELKKSLEDSKNEMRKSLEDMKRSAMADFGIGSSSNKADDDDDENNDEPRIKIGKFENGVLTISEGFSELDDESLEEYKQLKKIVFPASLKSLESDVICDQEKLEAVDFSKVTQLKEIPDEFINGETRIKEFVIPQGVTMVGEGFLGDCGAGTKVFIPASVKSLGSINGNGNNDQNVYLFAANLDLNDVETDIKTLYVLPQYYGYYAKQLKECDSEARLREMPEDMMNFYKTSKSAAQEIVSKPAEDEDEEMEIETVSDDNETAEEEAVPEIKPASQSESTGKGELFSARLEAMISAALQDGVLTDKERELLKKRVEKEGEDWDEVEMIIEARLAELQPAATVAQTLNTQVQPETPVPQKAEAERTQRAAEKAAAAPPQKQVQSSVYDTKNAEDAEQAKAQEQLKLQMEDIFDDPIFDESKAERYSNERIVDIPEGYTEIEENSFIFNEKLQSICLPSTLKKIGSEAFRYCSKLKQIDFSRCSSLQEIEDKAFSYCIKLEEIILPDSVKVIGDEAFSGCEKLRKIVMPSSLEKFGDAVFYECDSLEEVDFSKVTKLTTIPKRFETGNDEQMEIPMGVTTIRKDAFEFCNMYALFLPPTLKDYMDTNGNWESIYLFASPLEKMDNIFENSNNLYVLPQYLEEYKSLHEALGEYSWCEIHTMPDEYLYFYDN